MMKQYYVKVPNASEGSYYYKSKHGVDVFTAYNGRTLQLRAKFTMHEIEKYNLSGCERIEIN